MVSQCFKGYFPKDSLSRSFSASLSPNLKHSIVEKFQKEKKSATGESGTVRQSILSIMRGSTVKKLVSCKLYGEKGL